MVKNSHWLREISFVFTLAHDAFFVVAVVKLVVADAT